jgi:hypothetical protein
VNSSRKEKEKRKTEEVCEKGKKNVVLFLVVHI